MMFNAERETISEFSEQDRLHMQMAINLAKEAREQGEVPVGALILKGDEVIGRGWNRPILSSDPTAHAEIIALRAAGQRLGNYRLVETTLYVTLEPCVMCMGAISHARVSRIVFGAPDPKRGAAGSALQLADAEFLNHQIRIQGGLYEMECSDLLLEFFRLRRQAARKGC